MSELDIQPALVAELLQLPAHTFYPVAADGRPVTAVVDGTGRLVGAVTDGDLRRAIQSHGDLRALVAHALMTRAPKTVPADALAEQALAVMEEHAISALFVVDPEGRPVGVLHLQDLLRAGVV